MQSELLKTSVLCDFHKLWPEKFSNQTNGVTPRRFVVLDNPRLAPLTSSTIGEDWIFDLDRLRELEPFASEPSWFRVKRENKEDLALEVRRGPESRWARRAPSTSR